MRIFCLLLLLLVTQCLTASPAEGWLYSKPCVYQDNHDGATIVLEEYGRLDLDDVVYYSGVLGGTESRLETANSLVYDSVSRWKPGREVRIAYSAMTGAVLLDPKTGRYCEITEGLKDRHPLDALHREYVGEGSTTSVVIGTSKAIQLWKAEIKRVYNRLRNEFPEHVTELDTAEASWEAFYTAQSQAIGIANDKQGSLYRMSAAEALLKLVRDHARGLVKWGRY